MFFDPYVSSVDAYGACYTVLYPLSIIIGFVVLMQLVS